MVVAPYATALAAMVDPQGARRNYSRLTEIGASGRYGFYEALDFTRTRLSDSENVEIVRSFMAHHQGMTIVAIANTLHGGKMRERFHREPMIQASVFLLQERVPRNVASSRPMTEEGGSPCSAPISGIRWCAGASCQRLQPPIMLALSSRHYTRVQAATGAAYSCRRDLAVTR